MVKTTCRIAATGLHSKSISTGQWSLDSLLFFLPKQIRSPEPESGSHSPSQNLTGPQIHSFKNICTFFLFFLVFTDAQTSHLSLSLSLSLPPWVKMDQTQNQAQRSAPTAAPASASSSASRAYQFHPARAAIVDLFNLYLGVFTLSQFSSISSSSSSSS